MKDLREPRDREGKRGGIVEGKRNGRRKRMRRAKRW
jgi:hypothetical protein